jgi:hypothetical protein
MDTLASVADATGYSVTVAAVTPAGTLTSDPFSFDVQGGTSPVVVDAAPNVDDVTCTAGLCEVDFSSNSPDATSYVVTWLDPSGAVIATDTLDASAYMDTLASVADATGYSVTVAAVTPAGTLTSDPFSFDVQGGATPVPVVPGPQPVPAGTITVTANGDGTFTVTWTSVDETSNGFYLVSDDAGDTCSAPGAGSAGQTLSCVLTTADGSAPSGVTVTYEPLLFRVDNYGSVAPGAIETSSGTGSGGTVDPTPGPAVATTPVTHPTAPEPRAVAVSARVPGSSGSLVEPAAITAASLAVLAVGSLATWRVRRRHGRNF